MQKPNFAVTDELKHFRDAAAVLRRKAAALRVHRVTVNRLMAPLYAAYADKLVRWQPDLSTSGDPVRGVDFDIRASTADLPSFKDPQLMALLEHFIHADSVVTSDCADSFNRDFIFTFRPAEGVKIIVTLAAYVRKDSEMCRRIVRGTTRREVVDTEYELVCD
jgi:hypothetical protein